MIGLGWATYPLVAALIIVGLLIVVVAIRAAMPIKFDITISERKPDPPDDEPET